MILTQVTIERFVVESQPPAPGTEPMADSLSLRGVQPFLDDALIASSAGLTRTFHRPHKTGEILLEVDQPWEEGGHLSSYCSVKRENGTTRLWYGVSSERYRHIAYAESDDGLQFRKPILNLRELGGSKTNNVILEEPVAGVAPFVDPNASADGRYGLFVKAYPAWPQAKSPTEFRRYTSPDGLDWTQRPVDQIGDVDTQHVAFWNRALSRYVLYTRKWSRFDNRHLNFRSVRRLESDDLEHWDDTGVVWTAEEEELAARDTHTGQPALDYYGATVFPYPNTDAPCYVALAQAYWHWLERLEDEKWGPSGDPQRAIIERLRPAAMEVHFLFSRDGISWQRPTAGAAFMGVGHAGHFDSKCTWALPDPIDMGDELWIYYVGSNQDHDQFVDPEAPSRLSGLSRAVLRRDGYASLDAGREGGELTTLPFLMREGLRLNVDTGAGGCLRAEIQDAGGTPIDGWEMAASIPLCTNSTRTPLQWKSGVDPASLSGRQVRLRLSLIDARLFALVMDEAT